MWRHFPYRCQIGSRGWGSSGGWPVGGVGDRSDVGDGVASIVVGDRVRSLGYGAGRAHSVPPGVLPGVVVGVGDDSDIGDGVASVVVGDRVRSLGHGAGRDHSVPPGVRPGVRILVKCDSRQPRGGASLRLLEESDWAIGPHQTPLRASKCLVVMGFPHTVCVRL